MIILPFARWLRFLIDHVFIFGALKIVENRVSLVFIIADLPVNLLNIRFTRFFTAFYTPLIFCVKTQTFMKMFINFDPFACNTLHNFMFIDEMQQIRHLSIQLWK